MRPLITRNGATWKDGNCVNHQASPVGTTENSPPIHRWAAGRESFPSPARGDRKHRGGWRPTHQTKPRRVRVPPNFIWEDAHKIPHLGRRGRLRPDPIAGFEVLPIEAGTTAAAWPLAPNHFSVAARTIRSDDRNKWRMDLCPNAPSPGGSLWNPGFAARAGLCFANPKMIQPLCAN